MWQYDSMTWQCDSMTLPTTLVLSLPPEGGLMWKSSIRPFPQSMSHNDLLLILVSATAIRRRIGVEILYKTFSLFLRDMLHSKLLPTLVMSLPSAVYLLGYNLGIFTIQICHMLAWIFKWAVSQLDRLKIYVYHCGTITTSLSQMLSHTGMNIQMRSPSGQWISK